MTLQRTVQITRKRAPRNRAEAQMHVVLPILEQLGWRCSDPGQVAYDYPAGAGDSRADVALLDAKDSNDVLLAFVAVRDPGADLEREAAEAMGPAFRSAARVCVLTTGLEWWLYLPLADAVPDQRRFAAEDIRADPVEASVSVLRTYLERSALASPGAEAAARNLLEGERIARLWEEMLEQPAPELVEAFQARIREATSQEWSGERVAEFVRGRARAAAPPDPPRAPAAPPAAPRAAKKKSPKPTSFTLRGIRHDVKSWKQLLTSVADELCRMHGSEKFNEAVEKAPEKFVTTERDSKTTRVADSAYSVNAVAPAVELERRARKLIGKFGHPDGEFEIGFD